MTEGSASNIWVVRGGKVLGAPRDNLILEGIRYGLIHELCAACGLELRDRAASQREEVFAADELLLSSATKEVLPITALDGRPVGSGAPGPVFAQLLRRLPGGEGPHERRRSYA